MQTRPVLSTDLYELTMLAAYHHAARNPVSVFELFVRALPPERSYLVAAGLAQVVEYLCDLRFADDDLSFLRSVPALSGQPDSFFEALAGLTFTGDLDAIPEGTVFFQNEPVLRVRAPLMQAQLVESFLLTTVNFQTTIATKAARVVRAACTDGTTRAVVDFGLRRSHSEGAGLYGARAAFIGGCAGTSNVEAGRQFGIPLYGTAAHSFVMSFDREQDAFRAYAEAFPEGSVLLLDTYDTLRAAETAAKMEYKIASVRLDSGDLAKLSKQVREILGRHGRSDVRIIASGDLDEHRIAGLVKAGAPIDGFGVGTELITSRDAPALGGVYKLVEQESSEGRTYRAKRSLDKETRPGAKQVWRVVDHETVTDTIALVDEEPPAGAKALLKPVVRKGKLVKELPPLPDIQRRCAQEIAAMPDGVLAGERQADVQFTERIEDLFHGLCARREKE